FYYTWFMPATFDNGQMTDRPVAPYNSSLADTMNRQVSQARSAGIDAFITSWTGSGTDTDKNFAQLLDIAAKQGFRATVYFEVDSVTKRGDVTKQLQDLIARYSGHPAFLRWNGK